MSSWWSSGRVPREQPRQTRKTKKAEIMKASTQKVLAFRVIISTNFLIAENSKPQVEPIMLSQKQIRLLLCSALLVVGANFCCLLPKTKRKKSTQALLFFGLSRPTLNSEISFWAPVVKK
jgi:hypothetical protein